LDMVNEVTKVVSAERGSDRRTKPWLTREWSYDLQTAAKYCPRYLPYTNLPCVYRLN